MPKNSYRIAMLAGDGIGPEVLAGARAILGSLAGPDFDFEEHRVGADAFEATGAAITDAVIDSCKAADSVLVGAMDVARLPAGARQPLRTLRQSLEVGASVRPSRTFAGVEARCAHIDIVVVREVTEGVYSGIEYAAGPDAACAVRLVTRGASMRTARIAFAEAARRRGKVTAVHKLGALKLTDQLFLDACREVGGDFPGVEFETRNVDACALEMVRHPEEFDVIVATNAFGDILSDVAAGLACGLGLAPSGCIGERWAYFEPVHGTAPDIAGKGIANPLAAILTAALMLRHLGEDEAAGAIERAVEAVLAGGGPRTADLGGDATTEEVTRAVIAQMNAG
jgi:isocitrate/isopropylmalate dehydrogenase